MAEYSNELPPSPKVSYLTADHLGSPRIITDDDRDVVSRHDYLAFGDEVTETVGHVAGRTTVQGYGQDDDIRKQYTGYERDKESGLDFAQARYYNSQHGRFTSVDPLTASANVKNPQTFNRYSYVLNSPLDNTDRSGLLSCSAEHSYQQCGGDAGFLGGFFGDEIARYNRDTYGASGQLAGSLLRYASIQEIGFDPETGRFVGDVVISFDTQLCQGGVIGVTCSGSEILVQPTLEEFEAKVEEFARIVQSQYNKVRRR